MLIELTRVAKGKGDEALAASSLRFGEGAVLAFAETEQRPTVLGLIASGRMRPGAGRVTIGGHDDPATLRRLVALVDAPDVCDPAPNVPVAGIVAEELMFAGLPSTPLATRRWLEANGFADVARTPIADVQPSRRIRMLLELASLRVGVQGMVLVSPDRHGGDPEHWWDVVEDFAARGFGVLAIAGAASASVLSDRAARAEFDPDEQEPEPEPDPDEQEPDATEPDTTEDEEATA
jgi:hypothetical protein